MQHIVSSITAPSESERVAPSPSKPAPSSSTMSAGTIIADVAGSSRSVDLLTRTVDLLTRTPLNAWQDQVAVADEAPGARRRDLLSRPL